MEEPRYLVAETVSANCSACLGCSICGACGACGFCGGGVNFASALIALDAPLAILAVNYAT